MAWAVDRAQTWHTEHVAIENLVSSLRKGSLGANGVGHLLKFQDGFSVSFESSFPRKDDNEKNLSVYQNAEC